MTRISLPIFIIIICLFFKYQVVFFICSSGRKFMRCQISHSKMIDRSQLKMKETVQSIDTLLLPVSLLTRAGVTDASKERLISDIAPQKTCIIMDSKLACASHGSAWLHIIVYCWIILMIFKNFKQLHRNLNRSRILTKVSLMNTRNLSGIIVFILKKNKRCNSLTYSLIL